MKLTISLPSNHVFLPPGNATQKQVETSIHSASPRTTEGTRMGGGQEGVGKTEPPPLKGGTHFPELFH